MCLERRGFYPSALIVTVYTALIKNSVILDSSENMTTQVSTKIRLVRCPKCRQILPELPDVSLYKCGVCGTILQAKNRKLETNITEPSSSKQGENEAISSSNHDSTSPPKSEPSLDKDNIKCQDSSMEVKESLQEGDNFVDTVENSSDRVLLPKGMNEDNGFAPETDEKSSICLADRNDNVSQTGEQSIEVVDDATDGFPIFRKSSREKNTSGSADDSIVSFYLSSPEEEHLDRFSPTRNFGRISSSDTLGMSSPPDEVASELNSKHENATNYQKTRPGGNYYAYDSGSESSHDDQNFQRVSHFSRKNNHVDYVGPTERLRKDEFMRNNVMMDDCEPEMNYTWTSTNPSHHRPMKNSHASRAKSSEINMTRRNRASPSKYRHILLPPRPSNSEPDKADLLRTVCELQDQLNRMHFPNLPPANRMPQPGAPRCNISRTAFSGDAAHYYRHPVSCSCLHCSPQNCHYSAQLPTNYTHCNNGCRCGAHNDRSSCCNISSSSSPQHYNYTSPEFSLRSSNEKHQKAKRHLRPLVGGAPLVACYHCSEVLQLPADFLLFKKRCHKLMCSACKKLLKFSLLEGTRVVRYLPEHSAPPPPSVADGYSSGALRRNQEPLSHCSSCGNVEAVSFSDDYGRSLCKSCSTEGETSVMFEEDRKKDRKMKAVLREDYVEPVGPSSKWRKAVTSEIEEVSVSKNSPLHRLMGYSSPRHVLNK